MLIVDRINELAKKMGVSISTIEKTLGLSNGIIGKWRKQSPSCDKLKLVADYLNVSIDYLMTGKEYSNISKITNSIVDHSSGTITVNDTSESKSEADIKPEIKQEQDISDTSKELLKVFENLPMRERVKLLNIVYDFEEHYHKSDSLKPAELSMFNNPFSQNEQKLLDVFQNFSDHEQIKIIERIEEWLEVKRKRELINQQQPSDIQVRQNSTLAIARSKTRTYIPAPTEEQYSMLEEVTEDIFNK